MLLRDEELLDLFIVLVLLVTELFDARLLELLVVVAFLVLVVLRF